MSHAATTVRVELAGELVIDLDGLPQMALEQIKSALTVENEEKAKAASIKQFGWWDMPDTVALYRVEERRGGRRVLCLPRGFSMSLAAGMAGLGIEIEWDDQRSDAPAAPGYFRQFVLRDYQLSAALAMLRAEQGFYKAPAGSGKTVTGLGLAAWVNQRTLIVVDKSNLAEQWRSRAAQFYGFPMERDDDGRLYATLEGERSAGKIGEDVWEERDFTVALRQTLHSRGWSLDATKWWRSWGLTIFDEGHHLAAETTGDLSRRVVSRRLYGFSATPSGSEMRSAMVHALVGPIVAETTRQELYDRGVLMRPTVEVVRGELDTPFWPDHDAHFDNNISRWVCEKPDCRKQAKHSHRNNYATVLKALVESPERNAQIAQRIVSERGHVHLVPSRQKKHLDLLHKAILAAGWPAEKIWYLRGQENAEGLSQQIADEIAQSDEAVLLSTVADEGLDIPPIDRTHLVFPMRKELGVIQTVGRGERVCEPRKTDSVVYDYHEPGVSVFAGQFDERRRTYGLQGYDVHDETRQRAKPAEEAA